MDELYGFVLIQLATGLGFSCLALAMSRHWTQVTGQTALSQRRAKCLRAAGGFVLAISLALTLIFEGPNFGSLMWVLALAIGAASVALTLTWRPHWLRPLARVIHR